MTRSRLGKPNRTNMKHHLRILSCLFLLCTLCAATLTPQKMAGCTAGWYEWGSGENTRIRVYCQASSCTTGYCTATFYAVDSSTIQMECSCPGMANPDCRARFTWPGQSEIDIPVDADGHKINPADWTCTKVNCSGTCTKETAPNNSLPVGEDTPCKCN